MELIEYGKLKANPGGTTNSARFGLCVDGTPCIDRLSVDGLAEDDTLLVVTINGVEHEVTDGPNVSDDAAMREAIAEALAEVEFDIYLTSVYTEAEGEASSGLVIEHIGQAILTSITTDSGTYEFTRECDREVVCTFTGDVTNVQASIYINEDAGTALGDGNFANAAELQTAIETAFVGNDATYDSVVVTGDSPSYSVTIVSNASTIRIDDIWLLQGQCVHRFVPAVVGDGDGE